jgi:uncharacterized protein
MSLAEEIQKLEELRKNGTLSEEEFNKAKTSLLSGAGSAPPPGVPPSPPKSPEAETKLWGMILHLSMLAGFLVPYAGLVAPIVIWQIKKNELPIVDTHGKNAANFIISLIIYSIVAGILSCVGIGVLLFIPIVIVGIVFPIIAGIKANNGEVWKYPLSITIIK